MKKNKAMRLASALMVLTLLTTCVISSTFAKYTTSANGEDSARVASGALRLTMTASFWMTCLRRSIRLLMEILLSLLMMIRLLLLALRIL